jgi:transposase
MSKYIGFDIDDKKTVVCVVERGKKDVYETIGSDIESMRRFLKKQRRAGGRIELAFEISGQAGFIYDSLIDCVDQINVVNPSKMTWIYKTSKKNDRVDARKMAVLLSIGELPTVHMPNREVRQWRQMILHRRTIIHGRTRIKNRIRALLKSEGFRRPEHGGGWWKKINRLWMRRLCREHIEQAHLWAVQLGNLLDELDMLEGQLTRVTTYLDTYLARHPGGRLLMSIKGVGPRTSEAILAYTDDIRRFGDSKTYCSYFGMTPRLDESGSCRRLGHISKEGPSVVRWVLIESSWKVIRYSPALRRFYERVCAGQANRKKIAIVAVGRKLLSIMRAMMVSGELFNERLVNRSHLTMPLKQSA